MSLSAATCSQRVADQSPAFLEVHHLMEDYHQSTWASIKAICCSVNFDFFIGHASLNGLSLAGKLSLRAV
jgi:hypothetical protein